MFISIGPFWYILDKNLLLNQNWSIDLMYSIVFYRVNKKAIIKKNTRYYLTATGHILPPFLPFTQYRDLFRSTFGYPCWKHVGHLVHLDHFWNWWLTGQPLISSAQFLDSFISSSSKRSKEDFKKYPANFVMFCIKLNGNYMYVANVMLCNFLGQK